MRRERWPTFNTYFPKKKSSKRPNKKQHRQSQWIGSVMSITFTSSSCDRQIGRRCTFCEERLLWWFHSLFQRFFQLYRDGLLSVSMPNSLLKMFFFFFGKKILKEFFTVCYCFFVVFTRFIRFIRLILFDDFIIHFCFISFCSRSHDGKHTNKKLIKSLSNKINAQKLSTEQTGQRKCHLMNIAQIFWLHYA